MPSHMHSFRCISSLSLRYTHSQCKQFNDYSLSCITCFSLIFIPFYVLHFLSTFLQWKQEKQYISCPYYLGNRNGVNRKMLHVGLKEHYRRLLRIEREYVYVYECTHMHASIWKVCMQLQELMSMYTFMCLPTGLNRKDLFS